MHADPAHGCSVCSPGFPKENDGSLPWRDEEGQWRVDCPWPGLVDARVAHGLFRDWRRGITPVSLGRASWVCDAFLQAMAEVEEALIENEAKAAQRRAAKARG